MRTSIYPQIIIHPGYATGDMFGIVATLIDDDRAHVIVTTGTGPIYDPTDKGVSIARFYLDSGIQPARVHLLYVNNIRHASSEVKNYAVNIQRTQFGNTKTKKNILRDDVMSVTGGTDYVAEYFSENMRQKIRRAWDVNDSRDPEIKTWLEGKAIPVKGSNIAVIWSRFSGKKGDIHLEHDSSYKGIKRIVREAVKSYDAVIIAGDKGYTPAKSHKYDLIAQKIDPDKVFNLTEFWNENSDALRAWGGHTRFGQFKLYDFLHRHFHEVKHLGFRSGNLEVMALLGYLVRYMEEPGSEGGKRMAAWHLFAQGRTRKGGMASGYERLGVLEPPTRSGKYFKQYPGERRPSWAPGRPGRTPKPAAIRSFSKGFTERDMAVIMEYLQPEKEKGMAMVLAPQASTFMEIPEMKFAYQNALQFMNLSPDFNDSDLYKAYKRLALRYHPDKATGSHQKFILLEQAKRIAEGDYSLIPEFSTNRLALTD
ncbi:J domain-containing protein [Chryseobacterium sp. CT-SW4]|uniref:J domain-containing protein n=1 Tax=Chryseobacterium sp. SW-1 TaxID=3157343 RepID=UPI003B0224FA